MIAVERTIARPVAEVEPSDEYGVLLHVRRKLEHYTPDEAIVLASELVRAAEQAKADQANDQAAWAATGDSFSGTVRPVHGFDAAPVCRECSEGKHGACTGIALVDGDDVQEHPCGCSRADHQVIGGAE